MNPTKHDKDGALPTGPPPPPPPTDGQSLQSQSNGPTDVSVSIPSAPTLTLPKGGGAIRGMGEKFDVDPSTGTGAFTLPVLVSPGRGGTQPQLSLHYDSGAGNGPFGLGWRLSGLGTITRKTAKGLPRYNDTGSDLDSDVFLLSDAEDLVPKFKRDLRGNVVFGADGTPSFDESILDGYLVRRYCSRIEQTFTRIERWTSITNAEDTHWRTIGPQNRTTIFGSTSNSRIYNPGAETGDPLRIFSWLVAEVYDTYGNAMIFKYKAEDSANIPTAQANEANRTPETRRANRYIKSIQYGNTISNRPVSTWTPMSAFGLAQDAWKFSVVFDYGEHDMENPKVDDTGLWSCRLDPFSNYHAGFEVRTYRLCQRILMFHHFTELETRDCLVRSTDLIYNLNSTATYLTSAEQAGYAPDGTGKAYVKRTLPPVTFSYSLFPTDEELSQLVVQEVDKSSLENLPIGLDGSSYQWVDLDGEALSGILTEQSGAWFYKRNSSANNIFADSGDASETAHAKFGELEIVPSKPSSSITGPGASHFGDVTGSGTLDLIQSNYLAWGFYERTPDKGGWTSFHAFQTHPNINSADRSAKFVDLTGDGLADILICADQVYCWFPSLGADGYGPGQTIIQPPNENAGPVCVASDAEQTIYLADMSGDGLSDIVRIRNGDVCYWPNCGYGRFGAMVSMDNAPWFDYSGAFNGKHVRLVDIDGSGTTDILYLGLASVDMYLNQSGNSFAGRKRLNSFPRIDDTAVVNTLDLLGNGTTCIAWSSPLPGSHPASLRYVDLMRGKKPHLLVQINNNLGTETRIHYAPSTKFYLQDKENGTPWITRLPFPVQCVEKLEVTDRISKNRFVSTYTYHHGYFDGIEREFRGFGMVEHRDTEEFAVMSKAESANVDASWHVPATRTNRWFHTGAFIDGDQISRHMAHQYFGAPLPGDEQAMDAFYATLLPDTIVPSTPLTADALREACRALKGRILRTEIYAEDGGPKAGIPYSVSESNFSVEVVQPIQDAHSHSVYTVHSRESITYHYERKLDDPRIQHDMTLQVDDFGNVLKSIRIAYGRASGKSPLSGADRAKQETTLFLYTEHDVTNLVDNPNDYRIPVSYETREYELSGFRIPQGATRLSMSDFDAEGFSPILSLVEIPFEQEINSSSKQKRLVRQSRTLFRKDDLSGLLSRGHMEPLAIPGANYDLCFTPGLLTSVFKRQIPGQPLENLIPDPRSVLGGRGEQQAGYVDLDNDNRWWKLGGRVFYHPDPAATAAQELANARSHFFQPCSFADPFDNRKVVSYDTYSLFPILLKDPVGNAISAMMDYRVLLPKVITDPNGNRTAAAFDALHVVSGTATMGKASENLGDSLEGFKPDLTQAEIDAFFADPKGPAATALLGNATTRIVEDVTRYWRDSANRLPTYAATIARETHASDPIPLGGAKLQVSISYSDGFGRVIQEKAQEKSGPLVEGGSVVARRWAGSGWTIYNNKGDPVRQYEPFFDDTHDFKYAMKVGVSPIIAYDPLSRVVATLYPDHSLQKAAFDTWSELHYDACDNSLVSTPKSDSDVGHFFDVLPEHYYLPSWYDARSAGQLGQDEKANAIKSAAHSNTPRAVHLDALGRVILTVDDNGSGEKISTRFKLDIQAHQREVTDGLNRVVMRYDFSVCGDPIHHASMESGERWSLNDAMGLVLFSWNGRNFRFRSAYDSSRRLIESWVREGTSNELLVQRTVYGESAPDPETNNLREKPYRVSDQAGVVVSHDFDFKGNLLASTRQLAKNYKDILDWSAPVELEDAIYSTSTSYDALNRPVLSVAADMSTTSNSYNDGGHLDKVFVNIRREQAGTDPSSWTPMVTNVDHNAKKQLTAISYGNGTTSTRTYDPFRFRLERLQTSRPSGGALQDLHYTYDPIGNITHIRDDAQQSIYFRNARVDPSCDYTYDPLYRLVAASGREHLGQTNGRPGPPAAPRPLDNARVDNPGDGNAMGTYAETYTYDAVGNILSMSHAGNDPKQAGWKRIYSYTEPSQLEPGKTNNRLSSTAIGSVTENYRYDGPAGLHGNITAMPHLPVMRWDFRDQLSATSKQIVTNGGTPETTYYVYDSTGRRIRKVTERQSTPGATLPNPIRMNERIYLGGLEISRDFSAANGVDVSLERVALEVKNATKRVALIETRTQGADDGAQRLIRFQLDNQLESACIEVDDQARIISYEEFFPYGSTSYHAVANPREAPKRYRYSGKERDEESGMYYYGKRYYAPWLGRWISPDPKDLVDGTNVYWFVKGNPVTNTDVQGTDTTEARLTLTPPDLIAPKSQGISLMTEKLTLSPTPEFNLRTLLPPGSALKTFEPKALQDLHKALSSIPPIPAPKPKAFAQPPAPSSSTQSALPSLPSLPDLKVKLGKDTSIGADVSDSPGINFNTKVKGVSLSAEVHVDLNLKAAAGDQKPAAAAAPSAAPTAAATSDPGKPPLVSGVSVSLKASWGPTASVVPSQANQKTKIDEAIKAGNEAAQKLTDPKAEFTDKASAVGKAVKSTMDAVGSKKPVEMKRWETGVDLGAKPTEGGKTDFRVTFRVGIVW